MNPVLECILTGLVNGLMCMYMWSKLLDKKYDMKDKKTYLLYIIFTATIILNFLFNIEFLRIVVITIVFMIIIKITLKEEMGSCVVTAVVSQFLGLLSELIFALITSVIVIGTNVNIVDKFAGSFIATIFLVISNYLLLKTNIFTKLNLYLITKVRNLNKIAFIILSILIMLIYNYLIASVYYKINVAIFATLNTLLIIIYAIVIFKFLAAKNNYNEISNKYVCTLSSLKEYEDILDKYRVTNHENKNQLLVIRSMITKKDKNIPDYIDTLIDTTIKDNEKLMFDTNIIPAGGLRAIIYSKMSYMQDKDIEVQLDIERRVRTVDLIQLGDKLILDICKIIGVFLDNAIEEVLLLDKKEIVIKLYIENNDLNISITNNFNNNFDLDKIDNKGYTTKEKGHGYGLVLVKQIINQNSNYLKNERTINKNYFTQTLKIKIQNKATI